MNRHSTLFISLMALSLLGAGCITTGGSKATPKPGATEDQAASAPPELGLQAMKNCQETGGTYLASAENCMCPAAYFFEEQSGECRDPDGIPGGERGAAAREARRKAQEALAHAEARSAAPAVTASAAVSGSAASSSSTDDAALTDAGKAAAAAKAADDVAQGKCGRQAEKYMDTFAGVRRALGDVFTDFTMTSHFSSKYGRCYALVAYYPKSGYLGGSVSERRRTRYESLGDVTGDVESASCTDYVNANTLATSTECFVEGQKFTVDVYNDYVRQRMSK